MREVAGSIPAVPPLFASIFFCKTLQFDILANFVEISLQKRTFLKTHHISVNFVAYFSESEPILVTYLAGFVP